MSVSETKSATSPFTTMKLILEPYLKMVSLGRKQLEFCESGCVEHHSEAE